MELKQTLKRISEGNDDGNIIIGFCAESGTNVLQYISEDHDPICLHRETREDEIDEIHLFVKINQTFCHCNSLMVEDVDF